MISVGIASIPERSDSLRRTVESLSPQVDIIFIGLNNYEQVPLWFDQFDNLHYQFFDNSKGDAVKFYWVDKVSGYYLGCDDDLVYPNLYVDYMISKCNQYRCPVSLHGKTFSYPVDSYHKGFVRNFHCRSEVVGDHHADVIGTGVCCFKVSQIVISIDDFPDANMADLWFALSAKRQGVDLIVAEHKANWILYMEQPWTIWKNKPRDGKETSVINEILRPK